MTLASDGSLALQLIKLGVENHSGLTLQTQHGFAAWYLRPLNMFITCNNYICQSATELPSCVIPAIPAIPYFTSQT